MITNTESENKGNLFPSKIVEFRKDVDTLYFSTDNDVILQITVVRDSLLRFRYTTVGNFDKDFSYAITKYASTGYNKLEIEEKKDKYTRKVLVVDDEIKFCYLLKKLFQKKILNLTFEDIFL